MYPINYVDPDGNTEWHVTKHYNKNGKITKITFERVSDKVIGVLSRNIRMPLSFNKYDYYDFIVHKESHYSGQFGIFPKYNKFDRKTEILFSGGVKESNYSLRNLSGDTKSPK